MSDDMPKRPRWQCDAETYRGDQCVRSAKVHYHEKSGTCVTHYCVQHAKQHNPRKPFDHMEVYGE